MKFYPLLLLSAFLCSPLYAETIQGKVDSIEVGVGSDPHIIKLDSARVIFLDDEEKSELPLFKESQRRSDILEVVVDEENSFESAITVERAHFKSTELDKQPKAYDPTVISSSSEATSIFQRMRRDYQNNSQCYNRAHVWAYEEFNRTGLQSIKLFLFFTNRYIRNYRYKWWFHVSPMALVQSGNSSVERVFDRRFTRGTHSVKNWTDIFIASKRSCPRVERYNDYRNNQEAEDCYLIPVSMYFWQPRDILNRDQTGNYKTQFINSEVNWAYWEAF